MEERIFSKPKVAIRKYRADQTRFALELDLGKLIEVSCTQVCIGVAYEKIGRPLAYSGRSKIVRVESLF